MKKTIIPLLIAIFLVTSGVAHAQSSNSTKDAYVSDLQQVITLLQQEVTQLVSQLQNISNNQTAIASQLNSLDQNAAVSSVPISQNLPIFGSTQSVPIVAPYPVAILVDGVEGTSTQDTILGSDCQKITHTLQLQYSDGSIKTLQPPSGIQPDDYQYDVFAVNWPDGFNRGGTYSKFLYESDVLGQNTGPDYTGRTAITSGQSTFTVSYGSLSHEFDVTIISPDSATCQ